MKSYIVDNCFLNAPLRDALYQIPMKRTYAADRGGFPNALEYGSPWQMSGALPWVGRFGCGRITRRRRCVGWQGGRMMPARPGGCWRWQRSTTGARAARRPRSAGGGGGGGARGG